MRVTPSSVAFCTMRSMRSPRATPCNSVTSSGDSRSTAIMTQHAGDHFLAVGRRECRRELAALAIEQRERGTGLEAKHAREMFSRLGGQHDFPTRHQRCGHMDSRHAHASSIPSVVTLANRSISSGEMT